MRSSRATAYAWSSWSRSLVPGRLVLRAMLAESPPGETIQVNWLTAGQQWAIAEVVTAGIELVPYGPVMVRGMHEPPHPYIPSGGFG